MFIAGASFNSCSDLLDTETLSTDNLNYLCSNATDARKMVDHVYAYFCEDTYTSRMGTNWMQNTDVEIGYVKKAQAFLIIVSSLNAPSPIVDTLLPSRTAGTTPRKPLISPTSVFRELRQAMHIRMEMQI